MLVVVCVRTGVAIRFPIAIVDKDRCGPREHMVGVEVVDGEVVDPLMRGPSVDILDLDPAAGASAQPVTTLQLPGRIASAKSSALDSGDTTPKSIGALNLFQLAAPVRQPT
jgi:hypothetical protein